MKKKHEKEAAFLEDLVMNDIYDRKFKKYYDDNHYYADLDFEMGASFCYQFGIDYGKINQSFLFLEKQFGEEKIKQHKAIPNIFVYRIEAIEREMEEEFYRWCLKIRSVKEVCGNGRLTEENKEKIKIICLTPYHFFYLEDERNTIARMKKVNIKDEIFNFIYDDKDLEVKMWIHYYLLLDGRGSFKNLKRLYACFVALRIAILEKFEI